LYVAGGPADVKCVSGCPIQPQYTRGVLGMTGGNLNPRRTKKAFEVCGWEMFFVWVPETL
jgi:hypothetical protein